MSAVLRLDVESNPPVKLATGPGGSVARVCRLTGRPLPPGSTRRREFVSDRARVLNGKLVDLESTLAELDKLCATDEERARVRASVWRAGNRLCVARRRMCVCGKGRSAHRWAGPRGGSLRASNCSGFRPVPLR